MSQVNVLPGLAKPISYQTIADTVIILRTRNLDEPQRRFLRSLTGNSGIQVAVAVDETVGLVDVGEYRKISVTVAACQELGLHCPDDFAWRNGDYNLYLARKAFPAARYFWMIEPDVEHSFASFEQLIALFDDMPEVDLVSSHLVPADREWYWQRTIKDRSVSVQRCFFPLIRISSRAIDICLKQRQRDRFSLHARLFWPNDEALVATTVTRARLRVADLNGAGVSVYNESSFGYEPLDGDDGWFRGGVNQVYHPVLYGDAYRARLARQAGAMADPFMRRVRRKLQKLMRAYMPF